MMPFRFVASIVLTSLFLFLGVAAPQRAEADCTGGAVTDFYDSLSGTVRLSVQCAERSSPAPRRQAESRVCRAPGGGEIPCRTADGVWDGSSSCYTRQDSDGVTVVDAPEGDRTGIVMACTTLGGSRFLYLVQPGDAAPPDPRVLAQTAVSRMRLSAIEIGSFPWTVQKSRESMGVVGWNVWLWVDHPSASTFGPITRSVDVGGFTVTATAEVDEVVWDMGNGDVVRCGRGTPYPRFRSVPDPRSPDCGYVYTRDGDYRISATARWRVRWSGIGESGVIPMELTASGDLTIAEIQVVNVPVRDG